MDQFQDARAERETKERRTKSPSFDVLLRRFFRETQQSRVLSIVKQNRTRNKDVSRKMRRKSAIRKRDIQKVKRGW